MHINMKYYIVSVSAIFIALGIGVLVGFNINDNQLIYDQQSEIITDLEVQFDEFQEINNELEKELNKSNENYRLAVNFINNNLENLVENSLSEKNIGIISTNEKNKYNEEINELLTKAGASVSFDIVINENILNEENIKQVSKSLEIEISDTKEMISYIVDTLKNEDLDKEILEKLEDLEIIQINSLNEEYNKYSDVVLLGGNNDESKVDTFNNIDLNLINKFKELDINQVGVQQSVSKTNYSDLYFNETISSVDNVEYDLGKLSLVILLENEGNLGKYGILENAQSIIPYNTKKEN